MNSQAATEIENVEVLQGSGERDHLTNSEVIQWGRLPRSAPLEKIFESLLEELEATEPKRQRRRRTADRDALRNVLMMFVMELIDVARRDRERWLAYSRGDAAYLSKRYVPEAATLTRVVAVTDFLMDAGYAEGRKGSCRRECYGFGVAVQGYRSRLKATERLLTMFEPFDVSSGAVMDVVPRETIILKGEKDRRGRKSVIEYCDTNETMQWREDIARWEAMMATHAVELNGQRECRIHRVFNEGRWDRGGRFYGWWQRVPSSDRRKITFNGEATVELDFGALHPRLCYELEGHPFRWNGDPYMIDGLSPTERPLVKKCMLQLMNVSGRARLKAGEASVHLAEGRTYGDVVALVERQHQLIAPWFRAGSRGLELQAIDAAIVAEVLAEFTRLQRPVLPVHDSFIVSTSDEEMLRYTMHRSYMKVLGLLVETPLPPVIRRG